jgi:hypothetical protein
VVWKYLYKDYLNAYPNPQFVEKTFKNLLWEILKELKIGTFNEDNLKQATLQCDVVLEKLKSINVHANQNVLKR